jgi:Asp-tRNA(Asn)/Glu-tRNA(Gln) amidotransferase A subunit family amidase
VTDLWRLSASALLAGYAARAFSPVEVTASVLDRIAAVDPLLNSYLVVDADGACRAARAAEASWLQPGVPPALCGVPVHVKDTIDMAGFPTTYGSLAFRENRQPDAEIVTRLRASGAVILGKTNTPEFALSPRTENRLGPGTVNPWDRTRTAGGSSGGAAAAVAAGLGPIGIGTDSAGSVRLPAAYQGVFGIKPSFQRLPAVQPWRASPARSHNGPITRTVRDAALLLATIAGPHPKDPDSYRHPPAEYLAFARTDLRGARIAVSRDFGRGIALDADQTRIFDDAVALVRDAGATAIAADPPIVEGVDELEPGVWSYSGDHYQAAEAMIPDFWAKHADDLCEYSRPVYDAGRRALAWQYRRILKRDAAYAEAMRQWFLDYDFLMSPCCPAAPLNDVAERRDDRLGQFRFMAPFNLSYNPAAAIPMGVDGAGMPLAVQIVGRVGDDVGTLGVAGVFEARRPWAERWPPI